jgi:hypothetical protein
MAAPPWASGPAEVLDHGVKLFAEDTASARRLAMISIDNAVELTIRTHLGLPKRIAGLSVAAEDSPTLAKVSLECSTCWKSMLVSASAEST